MQLSQITLSVALHICGNNYIYGMQNLLSYHVKYFYGSSLSSFLQQTYKEAVINITVYKLVSDV